MYLDRIDVDLLLTLLPPVKGPKPGSRNALQQVLALKLGADDARTTMGPLAGVYDLRLVDAHPAESKRESGLQLMGIDGSLPWVLQGRQLLESAVGTLKAVCDVMAAW